jgi:ABC-type glycerol-3-phosphate transport system substrate-binding protein
MRRLVALLALTVVAAACGGANEPESASSVGTTTAESAIAGETLDGDRVSLEDFRGKPVFVNVWSSW